MAVLAIGIAFQAVKTILPWLPAFPFCEEELKVEEMAEHHDDLTLDTSTTPRPALETLRQEARFCRNCHLWQKATQTVFGEGPAPASIVLVGEQPGDKEDLTGHPFAGPAGARLDAALRQAGIDRQKLYITNAVKHFKFVQRGRVRLHQKPIASEINACHPWLQRELDLVQPQLVVALGASATQSVFGKAMPINKNRGHLMALNTWQALITIHPSYLLRIEDPAQAKAEHERFVGELALLAPFVT